MPNPIRPDLDDLRNAQSRGHNQAQNDVLSSLPSFTRRNFLRGGAATALATALPGAGLLAAPALVSKRILVGSGTPDGILAFAWDAATGTLTPEGIAAKVSHSTWLDISPDRRYMYVACELDEFE